MGERLGTAINSGEGTPVEIGTRGVLVVPWQAVRVKVNKMRRAERIRVIIPIITK